MDEAGAVAAFERIYSADRSAGRRRTLEQYQALVHFCPEAVARAYHTLHAAEPDAVSEPDAPSRQPPEAGGAPSDEDGLSAVHVSAGGHRPSAWVRSLPDAEELLQLAASASGRQYVRLDEIGRGGMGHILRVHDPVLGRDLAMKVLSTEAKNGGARVIGRFVREACITARLDHPGIVPLHELTLDEDGLPCFTMKLVRGQTLEEIFSGLPRDESPWTLTRVLEVFRSICDAVSFAHSRGVLHRDLKPANVMVGDFGEVYVMDWGLAKVRDVDAKGIRSPASESRPGPGDSGLLPATSDHLTQTGQILGTPAFMSPEQARGEHDSLDERSDVYAIGALLYQLLTGSAPYVDEGTHLKAYELVRAVMTGSPCPVLEVAPDVPPALAAIAERAMARNPVERYQTVVALREDVDAFLEGRVVQAYRTGLWVELVALVKRNRGTAIAAGTALLLAIGSVVAILFVQASANRQISTERDAARDAEVAQRKSKELAQGERFLALSQTPPA